MLSSKVTVTSENMVKVAAALNHLLEQNSNILKNGTDVDFVMKTIENILNKNNTIQKVCVHLYNLMTINPVRFFGP